jgi:hypothetical protein
MLTVEMIMSKSESRAALLLERRAQQEQKKFTEDSSG